MKNSDLLRALGVWRASSRQGTVWQRRAVTPAANRRAGLDRPAQRRPGLRPRTGPIGRASLLVLAIAMTALLPARASAGTAGALPFEAIGGVEQGAADNIASLLSSELDIAGDWELVVSADASQITDGCGSDPACWRAFGKGEGHSDVITGTVGPHGDDYEVTAQVHSVKTGALVREVTRTISRKPGLLLEQIPALAAELATGKAPQAEEEEKPKPVIEEPTFDDDDDDEPAAAAREDKPDWMNRDRNGRRIHPDDSSEKDDPFADLDDSDLDLDQLDAETQRKKAETRREQKAREAARQAEAEAERRKADEARRQREEDDQRRAEAARRQHDEERRRAEDDKRQRQEDERRAEAARQRRDELRAQAADRDRQQEDERRRAEADRQEQDRKRAEADRRDEERKRAEADRRDQERKRAEADRRDQERKRAEADRRDQERERAEAERRDGERERAEAKRRDGERERAEADRRDEERRRAEAERRDRERERAEADRRDGERERAGADRRDQDRGGADRRDPEPDDEGAAFALRSAIDEEDGFVIEDDDPGFVIEDEEDAVPSDDEDLQEGHVITYGEEEEAPQARVRRRRAEYDPYAQARKFGKEEGDEGARQVRTDARRERSYEHIDLRDEEGDGTDDDEGDFDELDGGASERSRRSYDDGEVRARPSSYQGDDDDDDDDGRVEDRGTDFRTRARGRVRRSRGPSGDRQWVSVNLHGGYTNYYLHFGEFGLDLGVLVHPQIAIDVAADFWAVGLTVLDPASGQEIQQVHTLPNFSVGASWRGDFNKVVKPFIGADFSTTIYATVRRGTPEGPTEPRASLGFLVKGGVDIMFLRNLGAHVGLKGGVMYAEEITDLVSSEWATTQGVFNFNAGLSLRF